MLDSAHTAIIGGGITGLCVAHSLNKNRGQEPQSFHLFESSNHVGGAITSSSSDGYLAEAGPNSLLLKDTRVAEMFDDIGLSPNGSLSHEYLPANDEAHKRYIVHKGKPHALPTKPLGMLKTPLFSIFPPIICLVLKLDDPLSFKLSFEGIHAWDWMISLSIRYSSILKLVYGGPPFKCI